MKSAFRQLETYKQTISTLFTYNGFMIISDGLEAKAGSISTGLSRFKARKTADGKVGASSLIGQLETLINGMLNKKTLLDLIWDFIVFEKLKKEDKETGIITIQTVKKLAYYHHYYAVNRAMESTLLASGYIPTPDPSQKGNVYSDLSWEGNKSLPGEGGSERRKGSVMEPPESYGLPGVKAQPVGDRKGGVVWHSQGSGKSLSMVFYTGKT